MKKSKNDWIDIGIIIAFVPKYVQFKRDLKALLHNLFSGDRVLDIHITNKNGEKNLARLLKQGFLEKVSTHYKFSDRAINNMINSFDPKTRRMEISDPPTTATEANVLSKEDIKKWDDAWGML